MEEEESRAGLDRRTLIKRTGIVTAGVAAWSTPMVSTLATHAAAGSPPPTCGGGTCGRCGTYDVANPCGSSGVFGRCVCGTAQDGSCVCWEDYQCGSGYQTCAQGETCPPGTVCMTTCCGAPECVPLCGTNPAPRIAGRQAAPEGPFASGFGG